MNPEPGRKFLFFKTGIAQIAETVLVISIVAALCWSNLRPVRTKYGERGAIATCSDLDSGDRHWSIDIVVVG
jgi:hypothetical protein